MIPWLDNGTIYHNLKTLKMRVNILLLSWKSELEKKAKIHFLWFKQLSDFMIIKIKN